MNEKDELKFTHSSVLSKNGKPLVSVRFDRGKDMAEGSIPDCRIVKSAGFSREEIKNLELYLTEHKKEIIEKAKSITGIKNWFR